MDDLEKNWSLIFTTTESFQAAILKGKLEENNIPVFVLNKEDSSFLNFGDIQVYVPNQFKDAATGLVNEA
jgi:hypothetical protein